MKSIVFAICLLFLLVGCGQDDTMARWDGDWYCEPSEFECTDGTFMEGCVAPGETIEDSICGVKAEGVIFNCRNCQGLYLGSCDVAIFDAYDWCVN